MILFDCLNEYHGTYGARARHRTIAEVVWLRCGGSSDKEKILQDALVHLNLNFGPDKDAFDQFVRADVMVDSISTLDGKIRFFDTACRKQPDSPYVRQHYARMLAREGKFELALSQIEEGIKLNPRVRVLYHTKGKILTELTSATESTDLARRRLVQAEEAFRHGLQMLRSDEFCIQGLAELYLGWAKRCTASSEAADYIAKAEGTITEGLKVVRVRDGLRIVSSQIADWLGNRPDHVKALETAVKESPHSIIARYLLGRTYRRSGHPDRAVTVLEPLVKEHPEEFRACVELARSLVALKQPYSKAIAILHLSTLHGFSDPRFIATLGGMLFLNREFSEADKVFGESLKLGLASGEINRPEFRPRDNSDNSRPLRLNGKVASVKKGYAFIDAEEHPNVFCPGSRWGGIIMQRGVRVTFDIVFSAKGPQADNVTTL